MNLWVWFVKRGFESRFELKRQVCACVWLTGTAEGLFSRDALVAGRAERCSRHGQRVEEVTVAVACLSLPRFSFSLPHAFLLLILIKTQNKAFQGKRANHLQTKIILALHCKKTILRWPNNNWHKETTMILLHSSFYCVSVSSATLVQSSRTGKQPTKREEFWMKAQWPNWTLEGLYFRFETFRHINWFSLDLLRWAFRVHSSFWILNSTIKSRAHSCPSLNVLVLVHKLVSNFMLSSFLTFLFTAMSVNSL